MPTNKELNISLAEQPFIDEAIKYALGRNPALSGINKERVARLVGNAASEIAKFEELARTNPLRIPEMPEEAKRIKVIWDISFAGTYLKEFQDDRWKAIPWAGWTDRRRLNYSAALMRRLTEKITGKSYKVPLGRKLTTEQVEELRSDIEKSGPYLIYGATTEQNEDVEMVLTEQGVVIPRCKVHIIKEKIVNTVDQMETFSLPTGFQIQNGDILALVAHAPHMVRVLHMLNRYKPIPSGMIVQPHPLPSPPSAGINYAMQEISGLLYYTFISGDSTEESYPYQI